MGEATAGPKHAGLGGRIISDIGWAASLKRDLGMHRMVRRSADFPVLSRGGAGVESSPSSEKSPREALCAFDPLFGSVCGRPAVVLPGVVSRVPKWGPHARPFRCSASFFEGLPETILPPSSLNVGRERWGLGFSRRSARVGGGLGDFCAQERSFPASGGRGGARVRRSPLVGLSPGVGRRRPRLRARLAAPAASYFEKRRGPSSSSIPGGGGLRAVAVSSGRGAKRGRPCNPAPPADA